MKGLLKSAKVNMFNVELTDVVISTAIAFKEAYSYLAAFNDRIENIEYC